MANQSTTENPNNRTTFKQYLIFWVGQLFSLLGSYIVQFSAFWWINAQKHDPTFLSTAIVLIELPLIVFSFFSGAIVDKYSRKKIIIIADFLQAIFTLTLILLFLFIETNLWLVIFLFILRSCCQAFHQPASNAIIPLMVPKDKLSRMNGLNFLTSTAIHVVGPVISGMLLGILDFYQILWVDIITFIIAVIPAILIKIPEITQNNNINYLKNTEIPQKSHNSLKNDIREGFQTLFQIKGMLAFFITAVIANFLFRPFSTMRPFFISDYHHGSEQEYALLATISQIGMMCGSLLMVLKKNWRHKTWTMMLWLIFSSLMYIFSGLVPIGDFKLLYLCGFFFTIGFPISNGLYMTILQIKVPPEKQGRINALDMAISMSISPIMTFLSGPLTLLIGLKYLYLICGTINVLQIIGFLLFSNLLQLEKSHDH